MNNNESESQTNHAGEAVCPPVNLPNQENQNKFIELRAQGWSFPRIATELGVHRNTRLNWSSKFQFQIQNLKAMAAEALFEECFGRRHARWQQLSAATREQRWLRKLPKAPGGQRSLRTFLSVRRKLHVSGRLLPS